MLKSLVAGLSLVLAASQPSIAQDTTAQTAQARVKGPEATEVTFGEGAAIKGVFVQVGKKKWQQLGPDGYLVASFDESARDEWSVYLHNAADVSVILNLWTNVAEQQSTAGRSTLGQILGASRECYAGLIRGDDGVCAAACPEGQKLSAAGSCVTEVLFHAEANMSLSEAEQSCKKAGCSLATPFQVSAAWEKLGLHTYAFGRLSDGTFAVPVQSDFSNFKRGVNMGAQGGNQGYFYVKGCPPQHDLGDDGACRNQLVTGPVERVSEVSYGSGDRPSGFLVRTGATSWDRLDANHQSITGRFAEVSRNDVSIQLRDFSGNETITIDLFLNRVTGTQGTSKLDYDRVHSASNTVSESDRLLWDRQRYFPIPGSKVTFLEFGDDTVEGALRLWGALAQQYGGGWVQTSYHSPNKTVAFTEISRNDSRLQLRSTTGATMTVDFVTKAVTAPTASSTLDDGYGRPVAMARLLKMEQTPPPTAEELREAALINRQEVAANDHHLTSPLSASDLDKVMRWIGEEASRESVGFCWKPTPQGRGVGYTSRESCDAAESNTCEQCLALWYPSCDPGSHPVGCNICSKDCPTFEEVLAGAQNVKVDCGELCAGSVDSCATGIKDMVFAPINLALNIITFGLENSISNAASKAAEAGASAATGGAAAAATAVTKTALGPQWAALTRTLEKAETLFDKANTGYDNLSYLLDNVENFQSELTRWDYDYERNFGQLTSFNIDSIINQKFPDPEDRAYIKQKYGQYQLVTMMKADGWRVAQSVLTFASFEPTGVVSTIAAFAHPACETGLHPFPAVSLLTQAQRGQADRTTCSGPSCGAGEAAGASTRPHRE